MVSFTWTKAYVLKNYPHRFDTPVYSVLLGYAPTFLFSDGTVLHPGACGVYLIPECSDKAAAILQWLIITLNRT